MQSFISRLSRQSVLTSERIIRPRPAINQGIHVGRVSGLVTLRENIRSLPAGAAGQPKIDLRIQSDESYRERRKYAPSPLNFSLLFPLAHRLIRVRLRANLRLFL